MTRRLRDESGVALPLAIMVMVIIGVMGAGLLVFVRNDLQAVATVNQGQRAFEIAEAGIQAAKTQQLSDVVREHYDRSITNDCDDDQHRTVAQDWSPNTTIYSDPRDCSSATISRPTGGVTRNFAGGKFNVTIECFVQGDTSCAGGEEAPEAIEAQKRAFFKITSTGYYPADESGAKRKIEAIFHTNRLDVPTAYHTPGNIRFNGGVSIRGVSFFAGGDITKSPAASLTVDRTTPALYRNWDTTNSANFTPTSNLNTQARPVEGVGFAAEGTVQDFGTHPDVGPTRGVYDYDSDTPTYQFVEKADPYAPNTAGTISYPFDPNLRFDLALLESIARSQVNPDTGEDNYYEGNVDIDVNTTGDNVEYPEDSTDLTVFYVDAGGAAIDYNVDYDPQARGLIVVENGNLSISNSSRGFNGALIVTGDGVTIGDYTNTGTRTVRGFVVADGTMTLGGDIGPSAAIGDFTQRPGFFNMRLWSWRECYSVNCS